MAALVIAAGTSALAVAASDQQSPPHLHPSTLTALPAPPPANTALLTPPPNSASVIGPIMPPSVPVHVTIPAISVNHDVRPTGLNPDGSLHTPPLSQVQWPVWYKYSPTPGQQGPAVIAGHIDSATTGPGVFFRLGAMKAGDTITITRADGSTARFIVYKTAEYQKSNFPTHTIYGNTRRAELRLISCGGAFNSTKHSYVDDIVIYARLSKGTEP